MTAANVAAEAPCSVFIARPTPDAEHLTSHDRKDRTAEPA
jgi:hypothetical protein